MKAELKRYKKYVLEDHDRIAAAKLLTVEKQVCTTPYGSCTLALIKQIYIVFIV